MITSKSSTRRPLVLRLVMVLVVVAILMALQLHKMIKKERISLLPPQLPSPPLPPLSNLASLRSR